MSVLLLILIQIPFLTNAQREVSKWIEDNKKNEKYNKELPFQSITKNYDRNPNGVANGLNLDIDKNVIKKILEKPPATLTLPLPMGNGLVLNLELARVNITAPNFKVINAKGNTSQNEVYKEGIFYRGIVKGDANSLASINIIEGDVSGFISYAGKKFMLGKLKDNSNEHVLYDDKDLKAPKNFACTTNPKVNQTKNVRENTANAVAGVGCKTVKVYFECDYAMYNYFGANVTNVVNYVNGFFSQVATLYANENIDLQISEIKVWTTTDPYASIGSTYDVLMAFDNIGSNFNGDLAHFITTRNLGGGIAYVDVLCNKSFSHGVSAISADYVAVPAYSWTVECVAHELGHNIGSNHTQWCGWTRSNGTIGPLDNCYPAEQNGSTVCTTTGAAPTNGGTIMSYCHLTSYGINFSNGFGTEPGNLLRSRVQNSTCLVGSGPTPSGLSTNTVSTNTASISWLSVAGASNYVVEYQLSGATAWTALASQTTLTANLTNLQSSRIYNWRVKTDCSTPSASVSFTTTAAPCSAPTNLTNATPTNNSATLNWTAVANATRYTIQYKTSTATTWTTAGSSTTNSYNLTGLTALTSYNWQVMANCSGYSTTSGTFTTAEIPCSAPAGLASSNISSNSATITWTGNGAMNYTVQYKSSTSSTWITATTTSNTSFTITGLNASTAYNIQVKASCSTATSTTNFTTIATTCNPPTGLTSSGITSSAANLSWTAVSGATNYTVQYKASTSTTWITITPSTTTTQSLTGLLASTTYNWQVKASCSTGYTAATLTTTAASCSAPTGLATSNIGSNSANLTWTAVSGTAVTGYTIQYRLSTSTTWLTAGTSTSASFSLTGLAPASTYSWQVMANCSGYSVAGTLTTICNTPTGLASSNIASTTATVGWTAVSGATSYTVQYRTSSSTTWLTAGTATTNSYNLTSLTASTAYSWQVKANCSSYSTTGSFTTTAAPCVAPSGLTAINVGSNAATLSWGAVSRATNYTVQYRVSTATTWTTVANITATSYNLASLTASTGYTWQVMANCSGYSTTATFTTSALTCNAPTGLTSSSITSTGATLTWTAVSNAVNYVVQYKTSTATTWTTAATVTTNTYNLTGLVGGTAYNWQVKASCSTGYTSANFTTAVNTPSSCAAPAGMNTTNVSYTSVTLVWNSVPGASTYTIQYKRSSSSTWITAATVSTTNYNLSGLSTSTAYNWRVKTNCSNYTSNVNFTTLSPDCTTPTNLTTNSVTATSAMLGWSAKNGISSYSLQYKLSTNNNWTTVNVSTNTYTVTGLSAGKSYNWRVKTGCSNNSSTITFNTPAAIITTKNGKKATNEVGLSGVEFTIYPNPSEYEIKLKVAEDELDEKAYYRILDLSGNLKKSSKANEEEIKIDISDLQEGTYIIQFISKSGKVSTQRLVKQ
jgi:hypothetical protein